ncbi:MAG TPA: Gfo/Idh/MocA family oxidoreductase [Tepidisphaeraceae bacterium]|jgi:predicted dehydrogenase|nr:Gfo/Idh/MocA family oxidoreductase [Tepidisphaeraceae bacterium]
MTNIGIIGLGFMGRTHYEAWQKLGDAQVIMVADQNPRRAAGDLSGGWGNLGTGGITQLPMDRIRGVTDFHELIDDPHVDVIDICVPTPGHVELALRALASGKHVLCEKPLALSSADARRIGAAAAGAGGFFMPCMCVRFWPQWEWLKSAVVEQRYGKVKSAVFRRLGSMPSGWFKEGKLSGGALFDLHVHDVDFIYHLFGKPAGVFSRGYSKTSGEIDHIVTQYLFDDYPLVIAEGGWCMADGYPFAAKYTVNFERGTADYDSGRTENPLIFYADGKAEQIAVSEGDGFSGELSYFLDCVKTGKKPTRVTADDAVAGLTIIEAEKKSVETGKVQPL